MPEIMLVMYIPKTKMKTPIKPFSQVLKEWLSAYKNPNKTD